MTEPGKPPAAAFPVAASSRWKPLRGGFLNLYRYDRQEFRYEDGRLLLRGNNGTGKSRVLALQLPFLLDGEISPARVEPDQDPAKRMEWNLLMGGKYDDRLGYSWLEFGRVDDEGRQHYQTIGCGLRAVQGRGVAQQWFFVTTLRVGGEVSLENEHGQPLTKAKLEECLGGQGRVFASGRIEDDRRDYRRAVDEALFGLGDRYAALLDLLIQLRQPQLSRKLDEGVLSDALSLALAPLPTQVLEDVAEAFRGLETDRQELEDIVAASESSGTFLAEYRRYIQIAARRRAEEVRKAHSAYEGTMRKLREAEEKVQEAARELDRLRAESERLARDSQSAAAAERTLRESPEMKSVHDLEFARQSADDAQKAAASAETDFAHAQAALTRAMDEKESAAAKADRAWQQVRQITTRADALAGECGLAEPHRTALDRLDLPHGDHSRVQAANDALQKSLQWKLKGVKHVEALGAQAESAREQVALAQQAKDNAEGELNESIEAERQALAGLEKETEAFFVRYREWSAALEQLAAPDIEDFERPFLEWRDQPEGENPVATAVREAGQHARQRLSSAIAQAGLERRQAAASRDGLLAERRLLLDGREPPPATPHTRDPLAREGRAGAPFWALCDFQPGVTDQQKAGIEAALEASGLLDAWVSPDGRLDMPGVQDSILIAGATELAPEGRRLDRVLRPDVSARPDVAESVVASILRHLGHGIGAGAFWVDDDGAWQSGPLHGRWRKPAAQFIGHASREAERQRQIAALATAIEELDRQIDGLDATLALLDAQTEKLNKEIRQAPSDTGIRDALIRIDAARATAADKRRKLTAAESRLTDKRTEWTERLKARDEGARDFKIAEWVDRLADLTEGLQAYSLALAALWPAVNAHIEALEHRGRATERHEAAMQVKDGREIRNREMADVAATAVSRYRTLESTVGKTADEVRQRLRKAVEVAAALLDEKGVAEKKWNDQKVIHALADKEVETQTIELTVKEVERSDRLAGLVGFVNTGQLKVAHDTLDAAEVGSWSVTRVVELAREIESLLAQVDHSDAAWKRNQQEIHHHFEALQTSLRSHGYLPDASLIDEVFVVSIPFQGRVCTVAELRDGLVADIRERRDLLDARERAVLENYLIDEVANHLHDLLHRAERWCDEANEELASRPMDTGMTLRFTWEPAPDAPPALAEARRLLLSARGTWSPAQRKAVGEFLQQRIRTVQMQNDAGTWQDHLVQAFDYRQWHRFGVERRQDGQWKRLNRRTHGTGSGGEKAIALTLPQLAAAAAHYRSASPHAPRLILLDEAFVGVDKDMRAKCLDLLCAFDLDVVMTSESEWACYPTVPAIAIYQLSARAGIDAVYASRWVWNGRQRVRDTSADTL